MKKLSNTEMSNNWGGQYKELTSIMVCTARMMRFSDMPFEDCVYLCALSEQYPVGN